MTETEYLQQANALFQRLIERIEMQHSDWDVQVNGAVLEIEHDDGQKIVVNQQSAMQEIWLASILGGYHFRHVDGQWCNTRDGRDFWDYVDDALRQLGGETT